MKKLLKHVLMITGALIVLLIGAFLFIRIYTGHGDPNVRTPNVEGEKVEDAIRILEEGGFDYEITDTVYRDHQPLLTIIDQNPEPDFEVKKGRKIYLVINSDAIPEVEMPDLAGKTSFNIAVRILSNRGLLLGKKITRPHASIMDPDSEPVLEQRFSGDTTSIAPGTRIKKHSKIDLVVGTMIKSPVEDPDYFEGAVDGVEIEE